MITYEELKRLNAELLVEARKELGLGDEDRDKLERIVKMCEEQVRKNESLKGKLKRDAQYQLRCQNIDARSLPMREILKIAKEGT